MQLGRMAAQQTVQAHAEFRCLDLPAVGGGDGVDPVGKLNPALEQRDPAVKFEPVKPVKVSVQTEPA